MKIKYYRHFAQPANWYCGELSKRLGLVNSYPNLSALAYAKLDDCSRDPLTIKMPDRRIHEYGGHDDAEEFNLLKVLNLDEA